MSADKNKSQSFKRRMVWIKSVLIAVIIIAIYYPVLSFDFVDHDDKNFIVYNPHLQQGVSLPGFKWAVTAGLTEGTPHVDYWQPVTVISRLLDAQLYGMNPSGHHATNLLIHILNAFLVWFLFSELTHGSPTAYLTAFLFAVHPLQVEPVAWVTARKDLLSVFFGLLSTLSYFRFIISGKTKKFYLWSFLFFILGTLSKPSIGIIFTVFLLMDFWPLKRIQKSLSGIWLCLIEKIPFVIIFACVMMAPFLSIPVSMSYYPKIIMAQIAAFHYFRYLGKILVPVNLSLYPSVFTYEYPGWLYLACVVLLLGLCFWFFKLLRQSDPEIGFGWLWFFLLLIPFAPVNTPGDRFTYFPIIGIIFLMMSFLTKIASRNRLDSTLVKLVLIGLILGSSVYSHRQLLIWKDTNALFEYTLRVSPENQLVQNDYGVFLMSQGKSEQAFAHYLKTQELRQQRMDKVKEMNGNLLIN